jgi:serine protease
MTIQQRFFPKLAGVLCLGLLLSGGGSAVVAQGEQPRQNRDGSLKPRRAAHKADLSTSAPETPVEHIVIKFQEGSRVRLRNGKLTILSRTPRERKDLAASGLKGARVIEDVLAVQAILGSDARIKDIGRLFTGLSEDFLARWKRSGEVASGEQLADLDLYYGVRLPAGTRFAEVESLIAMLNEFPSIEIAYAETPAEPAGRPDGIVKAVTPNFQSQQGYLNPAPQGIDALYAWTITGGRGSNVKFVDMEYAWRTTHEDFPSPLFHYHTPNPPNSSFGRGHGTAAVGVVAAKNNGFGVTGIASSAQVGLESNWNENQPFVATSIALAAAAAGSGGVVLLELQLKPSSTGFPPPSFCCPGWEGSCGALPLERRQADFDAIKTATSNLTTVIEPAGNGTADLDNPLYGGIFSRAVRDSGAVLVGARDSVTRNAACFTNWGSRVDVNAWGDSVVTLGCGSDDATTCGNLYNGGSEDSWYTNSFRGTSSASPIVAGAAVSLQGASKARVPSQTLSPAEIRHRLMSNATWVFQPKYIGPMPNLRGAFGQLLNGNRVPVVVNDTFTTPRNTLKSIFFYQLLANDSDPDGDSLAVDSYDFTTQHGSNDFGHAGGFNYTPAAGFVGTDVFSYRIIDARGLVAIGKVTIQVQ